MVFAWKSAGLTYATHSSLCLLLMWKTPLTLTELFSYNRYLAVAARAVRRSLQEGPRLASERRGQMDLRFAKWEVRISSCPVERELPEASD